MLTLSASNLKGLHKTSLCWLSRSDPAGGQSCQRSSIHHSASAADVVAAAGPATDAAWRCAGPRHTAGLCFLPQITF